MKLTVTPMLSVCGGFSVQSAGYFKDTPIPAIFTITKEGGVGSWFPCAPVVGVAAGVPVPVVPGAAAVAVGMGVGRWIICLVAVVVEASEPVAARMARVAPTPTTTLKSNSKKAVNMLPTDRRGLASATLLAEAAVWAGSFTAVAVDEVPCGTVAGQGGAPAGK